MNCLRLMKFSVREQLWLYPLWGVLHTLEKGNFFPSFFFSLGMKWLSDILLWIDCIQMKIIESSYKFMLELPCVHLRLLCMVLSSGLHPFFCFMFVCYLLYVRLLSARVTETLLSFELTLYFFLSLYVSFWMLLVLFVVIR